MGDKCEWKAEQIGNKPAAWKFEPCEKFCLTVINLSQVEMGFMCVGCGKRFSYFELQPMCKPTEPLIMKSGETWAAHWKVDYLWMGQNQKDIPHFSIQSPEYNSWVKMSDITGLTDEIAKLRPKVWINNELETLYGIGFKLVAITNQGHYLSHNGRLATARELQEAARD